VGAFLTFSLAYGIDLEALANATIGNIPQETLREAGEFHDWAEKQKRSTFGLSREAFVVCDSNKRLWREAHPNIATWWKDLGNAARIAINRPGESVPCRSVKFRRDGNWLRIALPSGRALCYPSPRVDEDGQISYMGINQYSRKWSRLLTYGGKLAENITQGVARDVLASSMAPIEAAGYEIVLTIHDEIIAEAPDSPEFNAAHLAGLMSTSPHWAGGLPLAAEGFEAMRYRK
jgi:DNA polymerase